VRDGAALQQLAALDPGLLAVDLADRRHRLAFWINIYNGAVRARLLENPEGYGHRRRFFASVAIVVAGRRLSANAIEHGILRRSALMLGLGYVHNPLPSRFERLHRVDRLDPRVHFALNCGARSCPPLTVWAPDDIDARLDAAASTYLHGETAVLHHGAVVRVPRLLLWYLGDFGGRTGIIDLLGSYGVIEPGSAPSVEFGAFDWAVATSALPEAPRSSSPSRTGSPSPQVADSDERA
jgi:hypothetical protein